MAMVASFVLVLAAAKEQGETKQIMSQLY